MVFLESSKANVIYDDALDRLFLPHESVIFRSFRIYEQGDEFYYFEVNWDYLKNIENETFLFSSVVFNPEFF